jgi:alpha-beta hydrolase superfamily lysophospholipase
MSELKLFPANLELRESELSGEPKAGLSHKPGGMFLLFVQELATDGEPRGALTVVHDAGDHGGRYAGLAEELAARGWAVSLPDMRGHGRSEGVRGHSAGIVEAVRDLGDVQDHLAYMAPSAPRVLLGQGLGAIQALARACERPGELLGLVLANPLLAPRFELPRPAQGLRKLFHKVGPESPGRTGFTPESQSSDPGLARAWSEDPLTHDVISLHAGEQALAAIERYGARIAAAGVPTLLLQGEADPFGDPARLRAAAGGEVELHFFPGLRHDLLHELRRAEVHAALFDWLERLPAP